MTLASLCFIQTCVCVCVRTFHILDEERVLVELACGASLAAVYSGLIRRLQDEGNSSVILKIFTTMLLFSV